MRLTLIRSGGFLGSALPPMTVETNTLDQVQREQVESLVQAANFFALPETLLTPTPAPDRFQYDLEIQEASGRAHRVRFDEATAPAPLGELARVVRTTRLGKA